MDEKLEKLINLREWIKDYETSKDYITYQMYVSEYDQLMREIMKNAIVDKEEFLAMYGRWTFHELSLVCKLLNSILAIYYDLLMYKKKILENFWNGLETSRIEYIVWRSSKKCYNKNSLYYQYISKKRI